MYEYTLLTPLPNFRGPQWKGSQRGPTCSHGREAEAAAHFPDLPNPQDTGAIPQQRDHADEETAIEAYAKEYGVTDPDTKRGLMAVRES